MSGLLAETRARARPKVRKTRCCHKPARQLRHIDPISSLKAKAFPVLDDSPQKEINKSINNHQITPTFDFCQNTFTMKVRNISQHAAGHETERLASWWRCHLL